MSYKYKRRLLGFGVVKRVAPNCTYLKSGISISSNELSYISITHFVIHPVISLFILDTLRFLNPFLNTVQTCTILKINIFRSYISIYFDWSPIEWISPINDLICLDFRLLYKVILKMSIKGMKNFWRSTVSYIMRGV
jgi:hypothetical protein